MLVDKRKVSRLSEGMQDRSCLKCQSKMHGAFKTRLRSIARTFKVSRHDSCINMTLTVGLTEDREGKWQARKGVGCAKIPLIAA